MNLDDLNREPTPEELAQWELWDTFDRIVHPAAYCDHCGEQLTPPDARTQP